MAGWEWCVRGVWLYDLLLSWNNMVFFSIDTSYVYERGNWMGWKINSVRKRITWTFSEVSHIEINTGCAVKVQFSYWTVVLSCNYRPELRLLHTCCFLCMHSCFFRLCLVLSYKNYKVFKAAFEFNIYGHEFCLTVWPAVVKYDNEAIQKSRYSWLCCVLVNIFYCQKVTYC